MIRGVHQSRSIPPLNGRFQRPFKVPAPWITARLDKLLQIRDDYRRPRLVSAIAAESEDIHDLRNVFMLGNGIYVLVVILTVPAPPCDAPRIVLKQPVR